MSEPRTNKFTLAYTVDPESEQMVSVRLPWSEDRYSPAAVGSWISGLLPPLDRRDEIAADHDIPPHLVFRLLEILGRDLPGGVEFLAEGEEPGPSPILASGHPVSEEELSGHLQVVACDGEWMLPDQGVPSSHILRVEDEILPGSATNEAFALRFAANAGVPAARASVTTVLGRPAVVVARADRVVNDQRIARRHLENFGQICDIDTTNDDEAVYEERGGPGFSTIAEALLEHIPRPPDALADLTRLMVLHYVTGNTNAHAGTFSLLLPERTIAPLDTVLPAELYSELETDEGLIDLDHRLAMSIAGSFHSDDVTRGSLIAEAASWPGTSRRASTATIDEFVATLEAALSTTESEMAPASVGGLEIASKALVTMVSQRIDHIRSEG